MKFIYKLVITIALSVILTFLVLNISLYLLYTLVVSNQNISQGYNINEFNRFAASELLNTHENYINTWFDIYDQYVFKLYETYQIFHQNPSLFEKRSTPSLTSEFPEPLYNRTGLYFFTPNSTFHDEPYMDSALAAAKTRFQPQKTKRINIFYQSLSDETDIMARTNPATSDFIIPSIEAINSRFRSCSFGNIALSRWYYDQLSKSDNSSKLISIRLNFPLKDNHSYRILAQIQIYVSVFDDLLSHLYAYKSSAVALIYLIDNSTKEFEVFGCSESFKPLQESIDFRNYLEQGTYNVTSNSEELIIASGQPKNNNQSIGIQFGLIDKQFKNVKIMVVINKSETNLADQAYTLFVQQQIRQLIEFMIVWSIIVIALMLFIGFSIGDYLFQSFRYIIKSIRTYLENPKTIDNSYYEMKEVAAQQNHNRIMIQNMVSIIQKIEAKKKSHQNTDIKKKFVKEKKKTRDQSLKINSSKKSSPFDEYPLNLLCEQFQSKQGLMDSQKFQQIRRQIIDKIEASQVNKK